MQRARVLSVYQVAPRFCFEETKPTLRLLDVNNLLFEVLDVLACLKFIATAFNGGDQGLVMRLWDLFLGHEVRHWLQVFDTMSNLLLLSIENSLLVCAR